MEELPSNLLLEFPPGLLQTVRTIYELEKPGRMKEAVDILDDWVKQQNHFMVKQFPRGYLERTIIATKGSMERAKKQLDKVCTLRTLLPNFFGDFDARDSFKGHQEFYLNAFLPKMTKDYFRIYAIIVNKTFEAKTFLDFYRHMILTTEYLRAHDYPNGIMYVCDFKNCNMLEFAARMNPIELRNILTMLIEGYGIRIKGIHWVSSSKFIETMVTIFKSVLSEKLKNRLHIHKDLEALHQVVPKEVLPAEFGGDQGSLEKLHEKWLDELSSDENKKYMRERNAACTNEDLRQKDTFNDQYMGMPGTFRTLSVD